MEMMGMFMSPWRRGRIAAGLADKLLDGNIVVRGLLPLIRISAPLSDNPLR